MGKNSCVTDSSCGVQQGDPLGPLLFSLVLQKLILEISDQFPDLKLNAWYLDDGTLIGPSDTIRSIVSLLKTRGPELGLHLNASKCVVYWPQGVVGDVIDPEMKTVFEGIELLGCPIGTPTFMDACVLKKVQKMSDLMGKATDINDSQVSYHLMRSCLGVPKMNFYLRNCAPESIPGAINEFDTQLTKMVRNVLGYKFAQIPHHTRLLWALPFRLGGFGVACAELIKEIAYIAGVASSWPFQDSCGMTRPHASFYNSIEAIKQVYPTIEQEVLDENGLPNMFLQKDLNVLVNNVLSKSLLSSINEQGVIPKEVESRIQAILRARSTPHANDWLQAIPSLQNAIGTVEFQKLLQFHSGLEIQDSPSPCVFGDCDSTDIFGDHAISCKKTNQRIRKHDAIAKILHSHLSDCGFTCALDKGTSNIDQNRMGDVMVQNWYTNGFDNGDLYVDVSVAAPLCSSNIIKSAKEALYSADLRVQEKRKKYQAQTRTKT